MNAEQHQRAEELHANRRQADAALLRVVKSMVDDNSFPQRQHDANLPCQLMRDLLGWHLEYWHVNHLLQQLEGECHEPMLLGPRVSLAAEHLSRSLLALCIHDEVPEWKTRMQVIRDHGALEREVGHEMRFV